MRITSTPQFRRCLRSRALHVLTPGTPWRVPQSRTSAALRVRHEAARAAAGKKKEKRQHPNATNSSETSVGGVSGACGSSGIPAPGEAGCSSRGGSSSGGAGGGGGGGGGGGVSGGAGGAGHGCEQAHGGPSSHSTRESHAKFRHGLLQLMIHTIDPLHDGQSRAGIPTPHSITLACSLRPAADLLLR
ncbi:hypothetical protein HN011_004561 [Eciton burchellii]|nr:hypothetical protein HN011_004561 [Eciton burchellii]